tara:strand:+ start:77 stop:706 length:630 start_codon:yes stop_codon:yes gene_type:complete
MIKQDIINYKFKIENDHLDFYVNGTNRLSFNIISNNKYDKIFLIGPEKSGKSILGKIWKYNNNAIYYNKNFEDLINSDHNIIIDQLNSKCNEEELFHLINYCDTKKLKILIISSIELNNLKFKTLDLISRLKTFVNANILNPDDDMLLNILTKLFIEKQFIINGEEIFEFIIRRTNRTYADIIYLVQKLDKLSLEKKRQLTIPLIKEIL